MKEGKQEKTAEKDTKITILDRGIISGDDPGPQFVCCNGTYFPIRW